MHGMMSVWNTEQGSCHNQLPEPWRKCRRPLSPRPSLVKTLFQEPRRTGGGGGADANCPPLSAPPPHTHTLIITTATTSSPEKLLKSCLPSTILGPGATVINGVHWCSIHNRTTMTAMYLYRGINVFTASHSASPSTWDYKMHPPEGRPLQD